MYAIKGHGVFACPQQAVTASYAPPRSRSPARRAVDGCHPLRPSVSSAVRKSVPGQTGRGPRVKVFFNRRGAQRGSEGGRGGAEGGQRRARHGMARERVPRLPPSAARGGRQGVAAFGAGIGPQQVQVVVARGTAARADVQFLPRRDQTSPQAAQQQEN